MRSLQGSGIQEGISYFCPEELALYETGKLTSVLQTFIECPLHTRCCSRNLGMKPEQKRCWSSWCLHPVDNSVPKDKAGTANKRCGERGLGSVSVKLNVGYGPALLLHRRCKEWSERHVSAVDSALFSMTFIYCHWLCWVFIAPGTLPS